MKMHHDYRWSVDKALDEANASCELESRSVSIYDITRTLMYITVEYPNTIGMMRSHSFIQMTMRASNLHVQVNINLLTSTDRFNFV